MSVASLENGNLTLNSLTINNSQYAEALGYVPSQTLIVSTLNNTRIVNDELVVGSPTGNNVVLTCNTSNTLQVGADGVPGNITCAEIITPEVVVGNVGANNVVLACNASNTLQVGATGVPGSITCAEITTPEIILGSVSAGANNVVLSCSGINTLQVGNVGSATPSIVKCETISAVAGSIGTSGLDVPLVCVSDNVLSLGTNGNGGLSLANIYFPGGLLLTTNSSNQLVFNGNVIS